MSRQYWGGIGVIVLSLLFVTACGSGGVFADSPDEQVNSHVGEQNRIYLENQPLPTYQYSAIRDVVTQIYNLTVPNLGATWTVFEVGLGQPLQVCASRGFPIPFGVQLTSPEYMKTDGNGSDSATSVDLPQPEPSGVYIDSATTSASWVLCDFGNGVEPLYVEGNATAFSHPVTIENGQIVHQPGAPSQIIDLSRAGSATGLDPNTADQN